MRRDVGAQRTHRQVRGWIPDTITSYTGVLRRYPGLDRTLVEKGFIHVGLEDRVDIVRLAVSLRISA